MRIPFATQSYTSRSLPLSAQRLVNLYPEAAPLDAKSPVALFGTPGLKTFARLPEGPVRGLHVMAGVLYAVAGLGVYRVTAKGEAVYLGSVDDAGPVSMADNGRQLVIVTGPSGFVAEGDAVTPISDPDFPGAAMVTYLDGYHIFTLPGSGQFFISSLLDGGDFDALDFATAEGAPDDTVAVIADHRELWLFGQRTTEVWFNSGDADFPFERMQGAFIERGCAAPHSVAKMDNSIFWLGEDLTVYRADGFTPARISTHAVELAIEGYGKPEAAVAFVYTQEGHKFYVLGFDEGTWVYDAATLRWHERQSWQASRWRAEFTARAYGRVLAGDFSAGCIHELDLDTFTEAGGVLQRIATSPPIHAGGEPVFLSRVEIDLETGSGRSDGQATAPQVMLQWSDDGGFTWSDERRQTMGATGVRRRVEFRRLGRFGDARIFRLTITDPVKVAILDARAS